MTAVNTVATAVLRTADSQRTFRAVLDALARPGTPGLLPRDPGDLPPALVPVLALADLGTGVCVLEHPPGRWAGLVTLATSAPLVEPRRARLVAALRPIEPHEVGQLHRGDAAAPEDGALVALAVAALDGGDRTWRLSGPGVPGERPIAPRGIPDGLLAARAGAVADFPAGIDLLLVGPDGRLLGLPRTTTIREGH